MDYKHLKKQLFKTKYHLTKQHIRNAFIILFIFTMTLSPFASAINSFALSQVPVSITATFKGKSVVPYTTLTNDMFTVVVTYDVGPSQNITDFTINPNYLTTVGSHDVVITYYTGSKTLRAACKIECVPAEGTTYTIYFNSNGGSYMDPIYEIQPNATVALPTPPIKDNHWFRGWYTSADLKTQFTEFIKVTGDLQLYAKWEEKTNGDSFSNVVTDGKVSTNVIIDLTGHTYDSSIMLITEPLQQSSISKAVQAIAKTDKFLGIELSITGYEFNPQKPLPIQMTIPAGYDPQKTAVYYTTNRKSVMSLTDGVYINGTYLFNAYESGTYILMECIDQKETIPPSTTKPSITLTKPGSLKVEEQVSINMYFKNFFGDPDEYIFDWTSSNSSVASVDRNGVVTAKRAGSAIIFCTSRTDSLHASVTVKVLSKAVPITKITPNITKQTLTKGKTFQLKMSFAPKNASNKKLTYTSSNKAVAAVSSRGKITAKKKGSCTITIKTVDGSKLTKKIKITVK